MLYNNFRLFVPWLQDGELCSLLWSMGTHSPKGQLHRNPVKQGCDYPFCHLSDERLTDLLKATRPVCGSARSSYKS